MERKGEPMSDFAKDANVPANDCISRQAAIDAINKYACNTQRIYEAIKTLPSAQPYTEAEIQKMQELEQAELQKAYECGRASAQSEIIVCADCKHWICHDRRCGYWNHGVKPLEWCCHAEGREG